MQFRPSSNICRITFRNGRLNRTYIYIYIYIYIIYQNSKRPTFIYLMQDAYFVSFNCRLYKSADVIYRDVRKAECLRFGKLSISDVFYFLKKIFSHLLDGLFTTYDWA